MKAVFPKRRIFIISVLTYTFDITNVESARPNSTLLLWLARVKKFIYLFIYLFIYSP